jgi:hypothetical protein
VAEPRLIDAYLTELAYSVAKLPDAEDIIAESADHLLISVDRLVHGGMERPAAEAEALARYGSAAVVARVFMEEAKRGSAVSTSLTRRSGVAAMAAVALLAVGQTGNHLTTDGFVHAASLVLMTAGFLALAVGLWGIRRRHGGLGVVGRVAFWGFVAAPFIAAPFVYFGPFVWAAELLLIMSLLGLGMIRARVLPVPAVALFTLSPIFMLAVIGVCIAAGLDAGPGFLALLAPVGAGYAWLGWAMWREPALDLHRETRGASPVTA